MLKQVRNVLVGYSGFLFIFFADNLYKGHPPLEELIKKFRGNILGVTKLQLSHVQLSEKNWMVYCAKVWEHVRKSSFFVEYTKQIA